MADRKDAGVDKRGESDTIWTAEGAGWWISPEGRSIAIETHHAALLDEPKCYGFAPGTVPEVREVALRIAMRRGWTRARLFLRDGGIVYEGRAWTAAWFELVRAHLLRVARPASGTELRLGEVSEDGSADRGFRCTVGDFLNGARPP